MKKQIELIFNADDYALTKEATNAIATCFKKGYLNYTSIVVNTNELCEATSIARREGFLDKIGLHLNLSEGQPLTEEIKRDSLFCSSDTGMFNREFQKHILCRLILPRTSRINVTKEITAQMEMFLHKGYLPIYLDSHHHIHKELSLVFIVLGLMKKYGFHYVRVAKNTGKGKHIFLNRIINAIFTVYPGVKRKSKYLLQSLSEAFDSNGKFKGKIEIEVHPIKIQGELYDKTNDMQFMRRMQDVESLFV